MMKTSLTLLLLSSLAAYGAPVISEFMAENFASHENDQEDYSDWIEIHNPDAEQLELGGWALTDDPDDLQKWKFPTKAKVGVGITDMIDVAVYLHRVCPNTTSDIKFLSW